MSEPIKVIKWPMDSDPKGQELFRKGVKMYLDFEENFEKNSPPFPKSTGGTITWERHKPPLK